MEEVTQKIENPNTPEFILADHLKRKPKVTVVASFTEDDGLLFDISSPGNLSDIAYLIKLLQIKCDSIIQMTLSNQAAKK